MEDKMLNVQSFYRNQDVLSSINKLLIHLDLHGTGIDDRISMDELKKAKETITVYLAVLNENIDNYQKSKNKPLLGLDTNQRSFIKNFATAQRTRNRYKSILFKKDIKDLEVLMGGDYCYTNKEEIINSLTEVSNLLEEQTSFDLKKILVEI